MSDAAQAFIALPGGYGSLEELIEMVTWQQLGYHTKPVGILNVNGFYDHLISFVDHMVNEVSLIKISLELRLHKFHQSPINQKVL